MAIVNSVVIRSGGNNMRSQSANYLDYVQRTSNNTYFDEDQIFLNDDQKYTPSIVLGISDFLSMRRGSGN